MGFFLIQSLLTFNYTFHQNYIHNLNSFFSLQSFPNLQYIINSKINQQINALTDKTDVFFNSTAYFVILLILLCLSERGGGGGVFTAVSILTYLATLFTKIKYTLRSASFLI